MVPAAICEIYLEDGALETTPQEDTQTVPFILSSAPSGVTLTKAVSQSFEVPHLRDKDKTIDPFPWQSLSSTNGDSSENIQITKRTKENTVTEEKADLLVYLSHPCAFLFIISFLNYLH